ncbi:MAG: hypothetical protein Q9159_004739 [Coniocarpon cinnabarinum]
MPSDAKLTRALENAVEDLFEEDSDNVRPKAVRASASERLGLEVDWFANTEEWKARSKKIVQTKYEQLVKIAEDVDRNTVKRKTVDSTEAVASTRPTKKRTTETDLSKCESEATMQPASETEGPSRASEGSTFPASGSEATENNALGQYIDDGDLSSPIDEPPSKQRRKKKDASVSTESKKKSSGVKSKKGPASTTSAPDAELKELQNQLVQCGVRKVWQFHLKQFETHKQKIAELKRMLREVGMEGRFSKEKAKQIKETRELQADIEAIQEGEGRWGKKERDTRRSTGPAQTRVIDFDDEESD